MKRFIALVLTLSALSGVAIAVAGDSSPHARPAACPASCPFTSCGLCK